MKNLKVSLAALVLSLTIAGTALANTGKTVDPPPCQDPNVCGAVGGLCCIDANNVTYAFPLPQ